MLVVAIPVARLPRHPEHRAMRAATYAATSEKGSRATQKSGQCEQPPIQPHGARRLTPPREACVLERPAQEAQGRPPPICEFTQNSHFFRQPP